MDKIKKKNPSLKKSFIFYMLICLLVSFIGSGIIGVGANQLTEWYSGKYAQEEIVDPSNNLFSEEGSISHSEAVVEYTEHYTSFLHRRFEKRSQMLIYAILDLAQFFLIPLWILICVGVTGLLFYSKELKRPFKLLQKASEKIAKNELDFSIGYEKKNEIGQLCDSFENMRQQLDQNNREMWHLLEERKRLNASFSHELRTPLTVLKGYTGFLIHYLPTGQLSEEKVAGTVRMMDCNITRLERYVESMNTLQKLADITPMMRAVTVDTLKEELIETAEMLCGAKKYHLNFQIETNQAILDNELFMQVYENLLANGLRYSKEQVLIDCHITEEQLILSVADDGPGFSQGQLANYTKPFYRDENEKDQTHFGLGLYICKLICEKHHGKVEISQGTNGGGKVTAFFVFNDSLRVS